MNDNGSDNTPVSTDNDSHLPGYFSTFEAARRLRDLQSYQLCDFHGHKTKRWPTRCVLEIIDPKIVSPNLCPAELLPQWCAHLVVDLFNGCPPKESAFRLRELGQLLLELEIDWKKIRAQFRLELLRISSKTLGESGSKSYFLDIIQTDIRDLVAALEHKPPRKMNKIRNSLSEMVLSHQYADERPGLWCLRAVLLLSSKEAGNIECEVVEAIAQIRSNVDDLMYNLIFSELNQVIRSQSGKLAIW